VGPTVHVTYAEACEAALGVNPLIATTDEIAASLDRAGLDVPPVSVAIATACSTSA